MWACAMSIPTESDAEFLVSLQWRWRPLYCRELARLFAQSALRSPGRGARRVVGESHPADARSSPRLFRFETGSVSEGLWLNRHSAGETEPAAGRLFPDKVPPSLAADDAP